MFFGFIAATSSTSGSCARLTAYAWASSHAWPCSRTSAQTPRILARIHSIDLTDFAAVEPQPAGVEPELIDGAAATVVIRDGRVTTIERAESLGKATVQTISEHADGEKLLNIVRGEANDAIAHLHDANLTDVIIIDVPRGVHVPEPIVIDTYANADSGLTAPHTIVRTAKAAGRNQPT